MDHRNLERDPLFLLNPMKSFVAEAHSSIAAIVKPANDMQLPPRFMHHILTYIRGCAYS
jgi:hypothetical protein